jgi:thioredoxin-related protein
MKKILFLILIIFNLSLTAQEINWMSFEEAIEAQKNAPKKIIMDAYTVWCGPCKMLDRNTFSNDDVAAYINKNFYPVKFNAEGNDVVKFNGKTYTNPGYDPAKKMKRNGQHQLAGYFGVRAYPTLLFIDETSNLIAPITGYKTPKQLEIYLKLFSTDAYKTITTQEEWDSYVSDFSYQFNE